MNPLLNYQLAIIAQKLLLENGGFTLDEFGNSIIGDLWAVSISGKEQHFEYLPSVQQIETYLLKYPLGHTAYFGGWMDDNGVYYLDHTVVFAHKHTAAHEGLRNHQKTIFHLGTKEIFELKDVPTLLLDEIGVADRGGLVRQLCDEYGPHVILADVGLYLENCHKT